MRTCFFFFLCFFFVILPSLHAQDEKVFYDHYKGGQEAFLADYQDLFLDNLFSYKLGMPDSLHLIVIMYAEQGVQSLSLVEESFPQIEQLLKVLLLASAKFKPTEKKVDTLEIRLPFSGMDLFSIYQRQSWKEDAPQQEEVFLKTEVEAAFEGGIPAFMNYLSENITYPKRAKNMVGRSDAKVFVEFVVGPEGKVRDVVVIHGSGLLLLDREAHRVVSESPDWEPGKQQGQAVAVKKVLPVSFRLK